MKTKSILIQALKYSSIISSIGLIAWIVSDFYGGMIIHLLMHWWLIVSTVLIYGITLLITIVLILKDGFRNNKIIALTHTFSLFIVLWFCLYNSELLKSKKILDASLIDDLSRIDLIFRENGNFETNISGMFGYSERINGKYLIKNDSITFLSKPYTNDYIPNTVIIDTAKNAIFFRKNKDGKFSREKSFVNYFEINSNKLK